MTAHEIIGRQTGLTWFMKSSGRWEWKIWKVLQEKLQS